VTAHFAPDVVRAAARDLVIGVRVGPEGHRFTPVWVVAVNDRLFARSWGLDPRGWNARAVDVPEVTIELGGTELPALAARVTADLTNDEVDDAYRAKYHTAASAKYVADMTSAQSRNSTVEFRPR